MKSLTLALCLWCTFAVGFATCAWVQERRVHNKWDLAIAAFLAPVVMLLCVPAMCWAHLMGMLTRKRGGPHVRP